MAYHNVIGIDLGTTYSAVAVYDKERYEPVILKNEAGEESVPSVISFIKTPDGKDGVIIGRAAKNNYAIAPENTVLEIKRYMGELFTADNMKNTPNDGTYNVGDPYHVLCANRWYLPQEISALTLMQMKKIAENQIHAKINDAVITVPAYFTEKQKMATKEAAMLAGLRPLRLVAEPTAAAICYGLSNYEEGKKTYLVYDLGGGTFDVSIISVEESEIVVVATSGNPRLGGADFDNRIVEWAGEELKKKNIDIQSDPMLKARIRIHAESIKMNLSAVKEVNVDPIELDPQNPVKLTLTREKFEELINDLLDLSLTYVDEAINIAHDKDDSITKDSIDAILLVGGSSKIPKVKEKLLTYFGREESFVRTDLNPDAVVAKGAAILANTLAGSANPFDINQTDIIVSSNSNAGPYDQPIIKNITEHSLGLGVMDQSGQEIVHKIIQQASPIPITQKKDGYTNPGPVEYVNVRIYQGEGQFAYENTLIGQLRIGPMEPRPAGEHQFAVEYALDVNGLLHTKIFHINEHKEYEGEFTQSTGVGGSKAMALKRDNLLTLFENGSKLDARKLNPQQQPSPKPAAAQQPEQAPQQQPAQTTQPQAAVQPAGQPQAHMTEIPETTEIPRDFASINRRAKKLILSGQASNALIEKYNAFAKAVIDSADEDTITALADELEDTYHDSRAELS